LFAELFAKSSAVTQNRPLTIEESETLTAQRRRLASRAMSNVLNEEKQQQVIALGQLQWSLRRIEEHTGIRRETVSAYLKAAGIPVRGRGRPKRHGLSTLTPQSLTDSTAAKPANKVTTDSGEPIPEKLAPQAAHRTPSSSACEPYRETIEVGLERGRNAMAIWQDLVDQHGYSDGYQTVKRFIRKLRGLHSPQAVGIILTAPGEAQVDYGTGPMVRDEKSGKYRRTRLFVLTLGYSRKSVRLLVFRSSSQTWAELHEKAFRRLGGTARVVVLDNLREGVLTPDIYDAKLNPLYRDVLSHYGVVALPCRVRDPDRKGKVESGVAHAQKTPLKGQRFETLEEAQAYLDHWEQRWADTRIHGTTKRQVAAMFAEEKPFLQNLPIEPFRYYQYGERVVHLDGCVEVERAYYGLPPGWIGRAVKVQWDALHVRILDPRSHQLLREHLRQFPGNYRINDDDRSRKTPLSTAHLLARAAKAGTHIGLLCEAIYRNEAELGIRRILGIIALAKKHGLAAADDACAAALDLGVENYRFVRRYLERRPKLSLRHVDPLIRELTEYRDLINLRTKENPNESD
jgi:transposase